MRFSVRLSSGAVLRVGMVWLRFSSRPGSLSSLLCVYLYFPLMDEHCMQLVPDLRCVCYRSRLAYHVDANPLGSVPSDQRERPRPQPKLPSYRPMLEQLPSHDAVDIRLPDELVLHLATSLQRMQQIRYPRPLKSHDDIPPP